MISRGNFSFGSWCHFVGTGGGTVLDAWAGGLDKRLANDGFSEQTVKIGHPLMMLREKNSMIMTKYHC